ncbi:MAG: cytochrome c peroxidase [Pyrinomonadaceae bacterium]
MDSRRCKMVMLLISLVIGGAMLLTRSTSASGGDSVLNDQLSTVLSQHGFTGTAGSFMEKRLSRKIDNQLADLGRNLFHDPVVGLNNDNSCSGCHSATAGFGDTQSIAIGIENNLIVGPDRTGPRNQRRTPMAANTALFPNLMWNSRFAALSFDPFDNNLGFMFPLPEGLTLSDKSHLLVAQAFIPPTERVEAAGFVFTGDNFDLRAEVIRRINQVPEYRKLFGKIYPEVKAGGPITYDMFAQAIAEFEFTLVFANAPLDRFTRGEKNAMTDDEKRGALLFFGSANCVACHAVSGQSNEMFSDFRAHVVGIPQIAPEPGNPAAGNVIFDGPGQNEDFGLEQVTFNSGDRYKFRTSPIRNVALQPTFFHNGAFTRLEDAIRFHLNPAGLAPSYDPTAAGVAPDLRGPTGPIAPVLARLDPALASPVNLTNDEFRRLLDFVRNGLLDPKAKPQNLRKLIPARVPSGRPIHTFQ